MKVTQLINILLTSPIEKLIPPPPPDRNDYDRGCDEEQSRAKSTAGREFQWSQGGAEAEAEAEAEGATEAKNDQDTRHV